MTTTLHKITPIQVSSVTPPPPLSRVVISHYMPTCLSSPPAAPSLHHILSLCHRRRGERRITTFLAFEPSAREGMFSIIIIQLNPKIGSHLISFLFFSFLSSTPLSVSHILYVSLSLTHTLSFFVTLSLIYDERVQLSLHPHLLQRPSSYPRLVPVDPFRAENPPTTQNWSPGGHLPGLRSVAVQPLVVNHLL